MKHRLPPIHKKIDGRRYTLTITRVSKKTAQHEAKQIRMGKHGLPARLVREPDGKYCVYILMP